VVLANPPQMPPRTHRLLLVEVAGERWIADVGFGGQTLTAPIKLLADIPQQTPHGSYRLVHEGDEWTLQFNHHEHWQSMYHFDLGRQYASDYVMGNFWSAHWPQSLPSPSADVSSSAGRRQNDPHQFPLYPLGK
jgi:N-hydroxyarylamine O-acetyltransferase